ncbi:MULTISPECIES: hypothetical protein [unclassified Flavobacterium]|uniref:hypothetical protein n=1 Tax=unclassified Flavobacterium TaxID=196869 RepID=UPI0013D6BAD0|nr:MULTISPECIES: hypothetical protein [unclassified Flavobacterium]MBA5793916.1 hypothetical protein [Flavobacterium sp. xlx-221]
MKISIENQKLLIDEFNLMAYNAQRKAFITIGIEIQKEEILIIEKYIEDLKILKKEFVEKELENEANLVYCIENSLLAICHEIKMLVAIKEDKMDIAWDNLVRAQVIYGTVISNTPFESEENSNYLIRLSQYEKLLFPKLHFHSVGGIIKNSHCSICNKKSGNCQHIKGKLYNGELCTRNITEMELEEVSFVENPANKHCRILSIEQNGKKIDILTLREIK